MMLCTVAGTVAGTAILTGLAIWLAMARETDFGDPTAGVTAAELESLNVKSPPIRFTDVAQAMGITMRHGPGPRRQFLPEDTGSGLTWGDYDNDGDWDLYIVNFDHSKEKTAPDAGSNHLYRNDGDHFTDVTREAGVGDPDGFGMGAYWADYDGDGHVDLYVTNFGPNRLFHNRGDGTFEETAEKAGVADPLWSTGAAWGDFDRDGDLDLYVCNYVDYSTEALGPELVIEGGAGSYSVPYTLNPNSFDPVPNRLYRNRGDGTFEDAAAALGVDNPDGRSFAATFCDLDGDGWLDLYVTNDVSTNKLFRNMFGASDDGTPRGERVVLFADLSAHTGTADPRGSMGLSVAELNWMSGESDGLPDLFITHWVTQENALYQSLRFPGGKIEYRDKVREVRLGEISIDVVGWGSAFLDLDRDGRVDLAVANGSTLEDKKDQRSLLAEPLFVFWNDGKLFHNVAPRAGEAVAKKYWARGLAVADFDNDGDVDMAVSVNRGQPLLLRNDTETKNKSVKVRLEGPAAVCFGAKVEAVVANRSQYQWYGADVTYLGNHAPELVFGLGEAASVDKIKVLWADGRESALENVAAGVLKIAHPDPSPAAGSAGR